MNYKEWWNNALDTPEQLDQFRAYLGDEKSASRVYVADYILEQKYPNMLEVGPAHGLFYDLVKDKIDYTCMDICQKFLDICEAKGARVKLGDMENIPFPTDTFDVVYTKATLEHLASPWQAIDEMLRVARKEVIVNFFIKPSELEHDIIDFNEHFGHFIYNNTYSKKQIDYHLRHYRTQWIYPDTSKDNTPYIYNEAILHVWKQK